MSGAVDVQAMRALQPAQPVQPVQQPTSASIEAELLAGFRLRPLSNVYSASGGGQWDEHDEEEDEEDEEEDDEDWEEEGEYAEAAGGGGAGATASAPGVRASAAQPRSAAAASGGGAVGGGGGGGGSSTSQARGAEAVSKAERAARERAPARDGLLDVYRERVYVGAIEEALAGGVSRHTGRDDRATVEQVLDPRTRMILFKLLAQGFISRVCGCVSTGKEANVYFAERPGGAPPLALKIYKTSILVFKDRDRYVSGEYRFRAGYSRSNPRKMVKLWAEKEMRNLKRLHAAGLRVPVPHLLRLHVLAMDFVGADGWPAPRLKDALGDISPARLAEAYIELCDAMRTMWQVCGLVHGDLSEYNVLWHAGSPVVIDVSQSVETDHPRALEFLRVDCANVGDFFRRNGVLTLSARAVYEYVVHPGLGSREEEVRYLAEARSRAEAEAEVGGQGLPLLLLLLLLAWRRQSLCRPSFPGPCMR